jgi:hypothetical protein
LIRLSHDFREWAFTVLTVSPAIRYLDSASPQQL